MSEWFDRLAKTAATGVSRRDALKAVGGFLAGGFLLGLTGKARTDDTNNDINRTCQAFCAACEGQGGGAHGHCIVACKSCLRNGGSTCGACDAVTCCRGSATCCTGACVNLDTDPNNCGACGTACPSGQVCVSGRCGLPAACAPPTPDLCGNACVNFQSDVNNCGSCGFVCPACVSGTPTCTAGTCMCL
jgi:hypothetical protein